MKINFGKILHIAVKVAPHVIPLVGLAQLALSEGKKASKEHDRNTLGDAAALVDSLTGGSGA